MHPPVLRGPQDCHNLPGAGHCGQVSLEMAPQRPGHRAGRDVLLSQDPDPSSDMTAHRVPDPGIRTPGSA